MELIDRYINTFSEHLSDGSREDIKKELLSNIEDMLPENPTDAEIRGVLTSLGNPIKLAAEYTQTKRYLIGPGLYDKYLSTLKIVTPIVAVFVIIVNLLDILLSPISQPGMINLSNGAFSKLLVDLLQMVLTALIWVTVVFVILEKTGISERQLPFTKKGWTVDDLPKFAVSIKKKISRSEIVFSFSFSILFLVVLFFRPYLIGWYESSGTGTTVVETLFNLNRLQGYANIILVLTVVQLFILVYKLIIAYWQKPIATIVAVFNVILSGLVLIMATDSTLINPAFIDHFAKAIKTTSSQIVSSFQLGGWIFAIVFVGLCVLDTINNFRKVKE
jgi:hypothetical protein